MSNDVIDAMLDGVEASVQDVPVDTETIINIDVKNTANDQKIPIQVYPDNLLNQIFIGYKDTLGIKTDAVIYQNERTGKSVVDGNITVTGFDLKENDVLSLVPDGSVAYSYNNNLFN